MLMQGTRGRNKQPVLFLLGFLFYVFYVILTNVTKTFGITDIYYAIVLLFCLSEIKLIKRVKSIPWELWLYLGIIVGGQILMNGAPLLFLRAFFKIFVSIILVLYIIGNPQTRMDSYLKGLLWGAFFTCFYLFAYASGDYVKDGSADVRRSLEFFGISESGFMSCITYFGGLCYYLTKRKKKYLLVMATGIAVAFYTVSKNAIASLFIITVLLILIQNGIKINKGILALFAVFAIVLFYFSDSFSVIEEQVSIGTDDVGSNGDFSINGRGFIWAAALQIYSTSPLLGYGYYGGIQKLMDFLGDNYFQAHNLIVHSLLTVGLIGTFSLILCYFKLIHKLRRLFYANKKNPLYLWYLCYAMYVITRGVTEGSIAQMSSFDSFFFFIIAIIVNFLYKQINLSANK